MQRTARPLSRFTALIAFAGAATVTACADPFVFGDGNTARDANGAMDATTNDARGTDASGDTAASGRVCRRASDCDDSVPCTDDVCGDDSRCVNVPNASRCDDGVFCNGPEVCDVRRGCARGLPVACNDNDVCTADRCVEATRTCTHVPLDRDGDGDPDDHCSAQACGDAGIPEPAPGVTTPCWHGHDCDDGDPRVSSLAVEICGDMVDNNCDGMTDSAQAGGCQRGAHDRCDDPLDVSQGGSFTIDVASTLPDYPLACSVPVGHDAVARFHLDEPHDVTLEGSSTSGLVSLQLDTVCGTAVSANVLDCSASYPSSIRKHALPAGDYFVIIGATGTMPAALNVTIGPPTPPPANETCASATVIPPEGGTFSGDLAGTRDDVSTMCGGTAHDLLYTFTLAHEADVTLQLAARLRTDSFFLSLLSDCPAHTATVRCDSGANVSFLQHRLAAGTYHVAVESFASGAYTLQAAFTDPTDAPVGDVCASALPLVAGTPVRVATAGYQNDYRLTCYPYGRDGTLAFTLAQRSDVLVDVTSAGSDYFAVGITQDCAATTQRTCISANRPRATALSLEAGRYFVIVKNAGASPYDVALSTFAPLAAVTVTGNDTCATAFPLPDARGYFTGDTTHAANDYTYACMGLPTSEGNDVAFSIHLDARKRLTFITDTTFFHVVYLTSPSTGCPGRAPPGASGATCTYGSHSLLDVTLDAGDYRFVIDGYQRTESGAYTLQLLTGDP